jgi:hypothetical protein
MSNTYKIAAGAFAVLILIALVVYLVWLRPGDSDQPFEPVETVLPTPEPEPTPTLAEQLSARLSGVTLNTSDQIVGDLVAELSSHPELVAWMANEDLVRRFAAAVENVAAGSSPRRHLDFLRPSRSFRAVEKNGRFYVHPSSYTRYDLPVEVFTSLDTEGTIALYRELRPLADEAYREISPPGAVFEDRLIAAIDHLLAVRPPTAAVELEERTVTTYEYADDGLAALSDAQRHLLRMGPDNVRQVQAKLRELRDALQTPAPEE